MKPLLNFIGDINIQLSAVNAGIWIGIADWTIKIAFGLPSAVYVCLRIYQEFIKKQKPQSNG